MDKTVLRVCQDRYLPHEVNRPTRLRTLPGGVRAVLPDIRKLWINGSTLHVHFMGGTPAQQRLTMAEAELWTEHANLRFEVVNDPTAEIRISFDPADGAWSYIGTDCVSIATGQATMNLGFMDGGTAAHEFGHAIGLGHEHQNPASGIEWNEEAVIASLSGPPNDWDADTIRRNVLERYAVDHLRGTNFDRESIMLYFFPGSWVKSGVGTDAKRELSALDEAFIGSRDAYQKVDINPVWLKVDAIEPTEATIGKTAEEDLFEFEVIANGRYVAETGGQTDVVMKLYGPNSNTALLAEDDDGGQRLNARIAMDLIPGTYTLQVRHFNRESGKGVYTVAVHT